MVDLSLTPGTILCSSERQYTICKKLGSGGFGITYLAETKVRVGNFSSKTFVAIKECFASTICQRGSDGATMCYSQANAELMGNALKAFLSEANRLNCTEMLQQSNVVKVNEVFQANNTAYFVMEYLEGVNLNEYVKRFKRDNQGRSLSFDHAAKLLEPIFRAMASLHNRKITHYDIKPHNIMIVEDERPVLIDFGLAKHYDDQGNATSIINGGGYTPGYAPVEQSSGLKSYQPTADVYALCATLLFCLTGHSPQVAAEIDLGQVADELRGANIDQRVIKVICHGMEFRAKDRPADANELYRELFPDADLDLEPVVAEYNTVDDRSYGTVPGFTQPGVLSVPVSAPVPVSMPIQQSVSAASGPSRINYPELNITINLQPDLLLGRLSPDTPAMGQLPCVSGSHARFELRGQQWYITDVGSSHGTQVNGMQCLPSLPINSGDVIRFAKTYDFYVE